MTFENCASSRFAGNFMVNNIPGQNGSITVPALSIAEAVYQKLAEISILFNGTDLPGMSVILNFLAWLLDKIYLHLTQTIMEQKITLFKDIDEKWMQLEKMLELLIETNTDPCRKKYEERLISIKKKREEAANRK